MREALSNGLDVGIEEEFLADAQASITEDRVRRAVLELGIATEVAVKDLFFGPDTRAGAAFEYMEDRQRVQVRVIELLDGASKEAFGKSYREVNADGFQQLDYLFRARNKVAHRGAAVYRDEQGRRHDVDQKVLLDWWRAVFELFEWIKAIRTSG